MPSFIEITEATTEEIGKGKTCNGMTLAPTMPDKYNTNFFGTFTMLKLIHIRASLVKKLKINDNRKQNYAIYITLLPLSNDSSSMKRISGVNRNFIRLPNSLRTYLAFDFKPARATSFPLSSPKTDT